jgi:hypothetical protein
MANTLYLPILGHGTLPGANVYQEPAAVNLQANDRYGHLVWVFPDTATKDVLGGTFRVPNNYVGTPVLDALWATTGTSGNVLWDFDYKAIADGESSDPSADDENATSGNIAVPGTARLYKLTSITLSANFAAQDLVQFHFGRDGVNESSGVAASVYLAGLWFKYNDA